MSNEPKTVPGPIADRTFERGFKLAAIAGAIGVALLYVIGPFTLSSGSELVFASLLYPIYLLSVAIALAVWLGYPPDERNLEPVYETPDGEGEEISEQ
ncbi:MAG: hypothetical protein BRD21_08515 [Halobacteriales archaeon SW_8_66_22]|jgi:hypothetical protein|nr:MAG: hypothetical protein BRD21_08515 [Halobacteriales archaeon SW_8_66_22]